MAGIYGVRIQAIGSVLSEAVVTRSASSRHTTSPLFNGINVTATAVDAAINVHAGSKYYHGGFPGITAGNGLGGGIFITQLPAEADITVTGAAKDGDLRTIVNSLLAKLRTNGILAT